MNKLMHVLLAALAGILLTGTLCLGQDPAPAPYAFPAPGTRWQMLVTERGKTATLTSTVLEDGEHNNARVHRIAVFDGQTEPRIEICDLQTGNWITTLVAGKPHRGLSASPYFGLSSWPLSLDTVWQTRFMFGTTSAREMRGSVKAYEDITVPAGTFKAYKVEVADAGWYWAPYRTTYWYAPAIGLVVKREEWAKETGIKNSVLKAYRLVEE